MPTIDDNRIIFINLPTLFSVFRSMRFSTVFFPFAHAEFNLCLSLSLPIDSFIHPIFNFIHTCGGYNASESDRTSSRDEKCRRNAAEEQKPDIVARTRVHTQALVSVSISFAVARNSECVPFKPIATTSVAVLTRLSHSFLSLRAGDSTDARYLFHVRQLHNVYSMGWPEPRIERKMCCAK